MTINDLSFFISGAMLILGFDRIVDHHIGLAIFDFTLVVVNLLVVLLKKKKN